METMQDLIDKYGEEYLENLENKDLYPKNEIKRYTYLGLEVITCLIDDTEDKYYTIVNNRTSKHVHTVNKKEVRKICECYKDICTGRFIDSKYNLLIRDKALKLCGFDVKYKG